MSEAERVSECIFQGEASVSRGEGGERSCQRRVSLVVID